MIKRPQKSLDGKLISNNSIVEHIPGPDNVVADLYSRLSTLQTVTMGTQECVAWLPGKFSFDLVEELIKL